MYKILAVAEDDEQKEKIQEITDESIKFVTLSDAAEEIRKNAYDFIISGPEHVSFYSPKLSDAELKEKSVKILTEGFSLSNGLAEQIEKVKGKIISEFSDALEAEKALKEVLALTAENIFEQNEWLELYISRDLLSGTSAQRAEGLIILHREYTELFPKTTDKAEEVILYILNNPESNLKQKTIASKLYINSSYLSTVFAAQTGMRFVDYLTAVKLRRAAYLLMNSALSVSEIASRLDYKDIGYFSRLFKTHFGMPPSQYRLPYNYTYEI